MKGLMKFIFNVGKLKETKRTGWIVQGIRNPESVAEHTYRVAMICMVLAKKFNLNENKLLRMALIHDLAEELVGDIVLEKGNKKVSNTKNKFIKENKAIKTIFSSLPEGNSYYKLWLEYEKHKSKESIFLKQIDKLEMVIQAYEYEKEQGSKKLNEFWINAEKHIKDKELKKIFDEIVLLRK